MNGRGHKNVEQILGAPDIHEFMRENEGTGPAIEFEDGKFDEDAELLESMILSESSDVCEGEESESVSANNSMDSVEIMVCILYTVFQVQIILIWIWLIFNFVLIK